jgi:hypothetical protein
MPTPGSREERGYGHFHRKARKAMAELVNAGGAKCCRCGGPILPGSDWHLDHQDADRGRYKGVSHATCNTSAGGRARWQGRSRGRDANPSDDVIYTGRDNVPIGTTCTHGRMTKVGPGHWSNLRAHAYLTRDNWSD